MTQSRVHLRPVYGPVVKIARSVAFDLTRTANDQGFFFDWSLSDVSNVPEFTSLFTQWRLDQAAITFTWRSANEANPTRPLFTFSCDPFATTAPASLPEMLERPNRTWSPNGQRTVLQMVVDAKALALGSSNAGAGALVSSLLAAPDAWWSTAVPSIAYNALLLYVNGWTANSGVISVKQDYMFSFRGSK